MKMEKIIHIIRTHSIQLLYDLKDCHITYLTLMVAYPYSGPICSDLI